MASLPLIAGPVWLQALAGAACGLLVGLAIGLVRWWLRRREWLQPARGKALTRLAMVYGVERKRWESDKKLRARVKELHDGVTRSRMHGPPPWA